MLHCGNNRTAATHENRAIDSTLENSRCQVPWIWFGDPIVLSISNIQILMKEANIILNNDTSAFEKLQSSSLGPRVPILVGRRVVHLYRAKPSLAIPRH